MLRRKSSFEHSFFESLRSIELLNSFGEVFDKTILMSLLLLPLVLLMAVRWLRLRQTQATWALLFFLSVSVPPSGEE